MDVEKESRRVHPESNGAHVLAQPLRGSGPSTPKATGTVTSTVLPGGDPCTEQQTYTREVDPERVGFAASGGGYRATLVHVGALTRINELGWLGKIARFSGVSGGSIALGRLAACWTQLTWTRERASNFEEVIAKPLIAFARTERLDVPAIVLRIIPGLGQRNYVEAAYRRRLVGDLLLRDLPETPQFTFNATSLQSGVSFRFTRAYVRDYRVGCLPYPNIAVATAMAASSAFPPFLSPYRLDLRDHPLRAAANSDFDDRFRTHVVLTDGGVYDNLGLQTLERFGVVIASDAGAPGVAQAGPGGFWPLQIFRVLSMVSEQSRARRRTEFFERITMGTRTGTLWTFKTRINDGPPPADGVALLLVDPDRQQQLAATPTRLWPFSTRRACELVNLGYALADAGLRSWMAQTGPAPRWPYPEFSLELPPTRPVPPLAGAPSVRDA